MTSDVLLPMLAANLAGGAAVLAVLALRRPLRALVGARHAYGLWLMVPAAMLATFLPARTITVEPDIFARPFTETGFGEVRFPTPAPVLETPGLTVPDPAILIATLWLAGVAAFLALLIIGQRRALRRFGPLTPDPADPRLARAARTGVGPALVGFFRPRVIVPADFETRFDARERALILAHERTHLSSGHALINAAAAVLKAVSWFNPLIHLGARASRVDQELACDAAVLARFPGERRSYAQALLKTQLDAAPLPLGCCWPVGSTNLLEERLLMLAKTSPGRARLTAGAAAVAALVACAGLAAWAAEPPQQRIVPVRLAQNAAGALGSPAQAKVTAPPAAATVKAGEGGARGGSPARNPGLDGAIAAGDIRRALELGASAREIAEMMQARNPNLRFNAETAVFVRGQGGDLAIAFGGPGGRMVLATSEFAGFTPPGGLASLPTVDEAFGPAPPPSPPTPEQAAIGARAVAGASAQETAAALVAARGPNSPFGSSMDPSTATYMRGPDGALAISMTSSDGRQRSIQRVPGAEGFPGLANLPPVPGPDGPLPRGAAQ